MRIYNRVLSSSEVSDLYDLESNRPPHSLSISQIQFSENLPAGSTIANLSAIDPNQDNLSFSFFSFSPLDLDPVLWLDADDPYTITTSSVRYLDGMIKVRVLQLHQSTNSFVLFDKIKLMVNRR